MQYVKIPLERVGVLIGENGSVKTGIERRTDTKISVNESEVTVEGEDSLKEWVAKDIVKAIGRGFNPEKALRLLGENNVLDVVEMREYGADSDKTLARLKGRIIGKKGKSQKLIEHHTGAQLAVYGKTVAIIGSFEEAELARRAVDMLLSGSRHAAVYRMLEHSHRS